MTVDRLPTAIGSDAPVDRTKVVVVVGSQFGKQTVELAEVGVERKGFQIEIGG